MNRRAFLQILAAAPIAALAPLHLPTCKCGRLHHGPLPTPENIHRYYVQPAAKSLADEIDRQIFERMYRDTLYRPSPVVEAALRGSSR